MRNVLGDEDRVLYGDHIVVTADHQRGAGYLMELIEGDMGMIKVEIDHLLPGLCVGSLGLFVNVDMFLDDLSIDERGEAERVRSQVGAGEGHLFDLVGMADREQQRVDSAIAPADDVTAPGMKGVEQRAEVVDDLFKAQ